MPYIRVNTKVRELLEAEKQHFKANSFNSLFEKMAEDRRLNNLIISTKDKDYLRKNVLRGFKL